MKKDLPKAYEHKKVEEKLSQKWQSAGLFKMDLSSKAKPFTILIPPPNITGALHMGHALTNTIQDVLIRYHKMQGRNAYWVAGTDHGGIATQNVIEKKLFAEQKKTRTDFSRDKFLEILWDWYKECGDTILYQFEKMGWSLDIEDVRFTMDDTRAKAVYHAFEKLWKDKKIKRGKRMINWCPRCHTALSDIEVEYEAQNGKLWHIHYPLENGNKGIVIATTRPETMLADTGVAVNPKDPRYQHLIGENLKLPLTDRIIPIVADKEVDKEFGTGAVKITPAHDPLDYEIGQRHKLPIITVISEDGKMIDCPKKYVGMNVQKARQEVAKDLESKEFLIKTDKYRNNVSTCYRCHNHIEPYLSEQWFVDMKDMAKKAIKAIDDKKVEYTPETWKTQTLHWLKNIQDWCISRQIIWGHRIPVWYCRDCGKDGLMKMAKGKKFALEMPAKCKCGSKKLYQDEDVLDTWFSSALWPMSTLGWPKNSQELKKFYPSDVMQTGYEIIYLWVARMIMFGLYFEKKVPFKQVSLNGIVRDKTGKKMSKSLGNVVDPLGLIDKYGADAVRFSLLMQASPGKDIPYGEDSIVGARNFTNKIYNAARFLMMHLEGIEGKLEMPKKFKELSDSWIFLKLHNVILDDSNFEKFEFSKQSEKLYHFLWSDYCDWYIELIKPRLAKGGKEKEEALAVAVSVFYKTLIALHPFVPFITEELATYFGKYIGKKEEFLINKTYPKKIEEVEVFDEIIISLFTRIQSIIREIRKIRSQFSINPKIKLKAILLQPIDFFEESQHYITNLAGLENVEFNPDAKKPPKCAVGIAESTKIYVPLGDFIDIKKEKERLRKDLDKKVKDFDTYNARLSNKGFTDKAPQEKVEEFKQKVEILKKEILEIEEALKSLEK